MSPLECSHIRSLLITAIAERASEAERLELEAHLERCAGCRDQHRALEPLRQLRRWEPPGLSEPQRERVRRAALSAVSTLPTPPPKLRRALVATMVGAFAVSAAVLLLALRPAASRVLEGPVMVADRVGGKILDGDRLRAPSGGRVVLDGPDVALRPGSVATWHAAARTLDLAAGSVEVEVDPRQGRSFRVQTARFRVEVLGTRFSVTLDEVRTHRGKVRVLGLDGRTLATLRAGESWRAPGGDPMAPAPVVEPEPAAVPASPASPAAPAISARGSGELARLRERLLAARRELSAGAPERARTLLRPALASIPTIAAEANVLQAESYLIDRQYLDAIASYRVVLRRYRRTPQAESALYAVAQLQIERSDDDAAARTLTRYLERYPHGRFSSEVRERLARLLARGRAR